MKSKDFRNIIGLIVGLAMGVGLIGCDQKEQTIKVYENEEYGFSLEYPNNWVINQEFTTSSKLVLYPSNEKPNTQLGYVGDIIVESWRNPQNIDPIVFYREQRGTDLFHEYDTVSTIDGKGWIGRKFTGVYGVSPSSKVLISKSDIIIALTDRTQVHQDVLDVILKTLTFR